MMQPRSRRWHRWRDTRAQLQYYLLGERRLVHYAPLSDFKIEKSVFELLQSKFTGAKSPDCKESAIPALSNLTEAR